MRRNRTYISLTEEDKQKYLIIKKKSIIPKSKPKSKTVLNAHLQQHTHTHTQPTNMNTKQPQYYSIAKNTNGTFMLSSFQTRFNRKIKMYTHTHIRKHQ